MTKNSRNVHKPINDVDLAAEAAWQAHMRANPKEFEDMSKLLRWDFEKYFKLGFTAATKS